VSCFSETIKYVVGLDILKTILSLGLCTYRPMCLQSP